MKLTLAQINPTVGAIEDNSSRIEAILREADRDSFVLFPEMTVTGYPLEDLAFSPDLQEKSMAAEARLNGLAKELQAEAIVGFLSKSRFALRPQNSISLLGTTHSVTHKIALPTYGVFDETRLFEPGGHIMTGKTQGKRFAAIVCEDAWVERGEALLQAQNYHPEVLFVLNGSPFELHKDELRRDVVKAAGNFVDARWVVYLNLVGGQDDLVFDGGSFIYDVWNDRVVLQLPHFEEAIVTVELDELTEAVAIAPASEEELLYRAAVLSLRDYVGKNNFKTVLVGVSGGIDSALVTAMAADAIGGENVYGVSMPSKYSSEGSLTDAESLMKYVGDNYRVVPISDMFEAYQNMLELTGVAEENLQARIRGAILMGLSNQEGRLVLTPGNKSEVSVGYSTLYGDTVGGFAPLKDLYKTQVFALAEWRNRQGEFIPTNSITKPPSAELAPGQVDTNSLPPYEVLDVFLRRAVEERASHSDLVEEFGEAITTRVLGLVKRAEWKRRQYPIGPKLTVLSFGRERVFPITDSSD